MLAILAALLPLPLAFCLISRRFSSDPQGWGATSLRAAVLFALGLAAAGPFLTSRAVGTGEAYNYSLALADGVTQMRAGVLPPLVGQTAFAFNGRVHPLRNAPYLFYLAGGLDFATGHRLSFWELQNFTLAFSLVAAVFACYGGLRWGPQCARPAAFLLAAAYVFSPALLGAAYTVNLFMTVHAAAFVPLALAACLRSAREFSPRPNLVLGGALAAAWLAHPPVALWLTAAAVVVRGLIFLRFPTWRAAGSLLAGAALCALLAGFVFASVAAISAGLGFFAGGVDFAAAVMPSIRQAFPGALLPVSLRAGLLNDFQLGYAGWGLLAAVALACFHPEYGPRQRPRVYWGVVGCLVATLLLLALTLPVPGLTEWLWRHSPVAAQSLTNIWPMQRLYLVAMGLLVFASACAPPARLPLRQGPRRLFLAAIAVVALWSAAQAVPFLVRGYGMRWSQGDTARSHLGSNLDLTVTAYAFLGVPPTFLNGVMDPQFELRLLKNGKTETASDYAAALAQAPVVARGRFSADRRAPAGREIAPQTVTLAPGRRYLLDFDFHAPPIKGTLWLTGPSLQRHYSLPAAGEPAGFGMGAGHRRALSVWTAQDRPETVEIRFSAEDPAAAAALPGDFADFTLREVDTSALPIRLDSLLPLRCSVHASEANDYVETPRRWLPGYMTIVNGRRLEPLPSPEGAVMVPVPPGPSEIELDYVGSPGVRAAFWVSLCSWLGFGLWALGRLFGLDLIPALRRAAPRAAALRRHGPGLAAAILAIAAVAAAAHVISSRRARRAAYLHAVGPVRVEFYLPFRMAGHRQPLVVTGRNGAGSTVFVEYVDESHVRIGADIWGSLDESPAIATDYFQRQDLVVDSSALYPLDHPAVAALAPGERERLRGAFRVELNGRTVLELKRSGYESTVDQVAIGRNTIGSSAIDPRFAGRILDVERLPFSRQLVLLGGEPLRLRVRFPARRAGLTEPLLSLGPDGADGICAATYLPGGRMRFSRLAGDGRPLESVERSISAGRDYVMEFMLGAGSDGPFPPAVRWNLDGIPLLGPAQPAPLAAPESVLVGRAPAAAAGVAARFSGRELDPEPPVRLAAGQSYGPLRLVVQLPLGKPGRQEPLVTTGVNGKGDFIYVVYLDAHHLRLGFDHWGVSGGLSDPLPVDYARPHAFVIRLGSLYPGAGDPAWDGVSAGERERLKSEMTVLLDGRPAYHASFAAHPSTPAQVTPGENRIGGSNCDPAFTGVLYSATRLGLPR